MTNKFKQIKYLSLFSGIGGFELGIQNAYEYTNNSRDENWSKNPKSISDNNSELLQGVGQFRSPICIGYSEIDKYATQVYNKHFNHKNYGDITKIIASELPSFELLVGGFPCQSFSIAGKRKGFEDTRGTLFFDIARILKEKQPKLFLLENVKGLLSHDKGKTFKTILSTLDELGYDVQWQILNSKNYGVPQNRERVFIVGHFRGTRRPEVFPIRRIGKENNGEVGVRQIPNQKISRTLKGEGGGQGAKTGLYRIKEPNKKGYAEIEQGDSVNLQNINSKTRRGRVGKKVAQTLDTGMQQYTVQPVISPDRLNKNQNGRRIKEDGEPSFTLTAQDRHGVFNGSDIRRLTPKECERLQGFPDDWTKDGIDGPISDTQRYKMCGNAVTVNVIEEIISRLLKVA